MSYFLPCFMSYFPLFFARGWLSTTLRGQETPIHNYLMYTANLAMMLDVGGDGKHESGIITASLPLSSSQPPAELAY